MTSTTPRKAVRKAAAEQPVDWQAKYEELRRTTRAEAIRVAREQRWCDDGLNQTLRNLGLAEKREYDVPVTVTISREAVITVTDAESMEDARAKVAAGEFNDGTSVEGWVQGYLGSGNHLVSWEVPEVKPPSEVEVGDLDPTMEEQNAFHAMVGDARYTARTCGDGHNFPDGTYGYCTRPRNHDLDQHVAGNGSRVIGVWSVSMEHPVSCTSSWWETLSSEDRARATIT